MTKHSACQLRQILPANFEEHIAYFKLEIQMTIYGLNFLEMYIYIYMSINFEFRERSKFSLRKRDETHYNHSFPIYCFRTSLV